MAPLILAIYISPTAIADQQAMTKMSIIKKIRLLMVSQIGIFNKKKIEFIQKQ